MGTRHLILVWYKGKWHIAQYGQWDGYPGGQGMTVFRFLTNTDTAKDICKRLNLTDDCGPRYPIKTEPYSTEPAPAKENIAALKAALDNDILFSPSQEEVDIICEKAEEVEREAQKLSEALSKQSNSEKDSVVRDALIPRSFFLSDARFRSLLFVEPSLARDTGAGILSYVAYSKEKVPIQMDVEFIMDSMMCEWAYVVDLDAELLEVYNGGISSEGYIDEGPNRFDEEEFIKGGEYGKKRPRLLVKLGFGELLDLGEEDFVKKCEMEAEREPREDEVDEVDLNAEVLYA
ncbi:unnamed protein product [Zymoseptoria tritici ST99CH_3D1]|uniref:Uncharacterized protein n=2 Tax=Zymoseptoria tritici TaxID=1047171 RepID=F9XMM8_ZYMTI|nr:uncharacterized protein MYCGRDRAFT_111193 [Zymoseptoria tritici IPO323]EGP83674.1 hypothetical protein MYCGRDRAFT_111193 [Zymoseptoria tritici IPO323]SMQ55083.1 unnamed protein product [Zymoseptoria tritici ST99CH_3D7]SMR63404.1 unnamed protein product [Zymoseptoria tritici ST99CH_3D1]